MKRGPLIVLLALVLATTAASADGFNPHAMTKADGSPDMERCALCHNADLSLSRSKAETCTLCHAVTLHGASAQHLGATAAEVAGTGAAEGKLPLTDDGRVYCGTCHYFHDPAVTGEKHLAEAPLPSRTGMAEAVRGALQEDLAEIARQHEGTSVRAEFSTKGTKALRFPVRDGTLCRQCHGEM